MKREKQVKKSMCITYEVDGGLYINMTNRCSNRCSFCIRNNGDGAYGSDSLWLEREPTEKEVTDAVLARNLDEYSEVVFCGYGEPSYRLAQARSIALRIKEKYPNLPIRINTNGHSSLILKEDSAKLYEGAFDTVSVSLNAPTAERYEEICHSKYKESAFYAVIDFAKEVKRYVKTVVFSVVEDFLTAEEIRECEKISRECGIPLRVRKYIKE